MFEIKEIHMSLVWPVCLLWTTPGGVWVKWMLMKEPCRLKVEAVIAPRGRRDLL